jgi:hypothetical protein
VACLCDFVTTPSRSRQRFLISDRIKDEGFETQALAATPFVIAIEERLSYKGVFARSSSCDPMELMTRTWTAKADFDIAGLFDALDAQRRDRALSWQGVAKELWNQSATLNARRNDHPIAASTLTGMAKMGDTTCQHALFMLRWLGREAECFVPGATADPKRTPLPVAGPDKRLRWDLQKLYDALDGQRRDLGLSWLQLAHELRCTPNQISGIRRAKFAISMKLAMRIVDWLDRPARDFVYAANW